MPVDVSVIIVSFNTRDILRDCLHSVRQHPGQCSVETIVIDNASSDGSADMVASEFPEVLLVRNSQNSMFAKASNQGISIAQGEFLLLHNSDAFLQENTLDELVSFMRSHPTIGAAGPKILNMDGSLQSKGFVAPRIGLGLIKVLGVNKLLPDQIKRVMFPSYFWHEDDYVEPDVLSGACIMLRSTVVQSIGDLRDDFYHGGEDGEWCFRSSRCGHPVAYCPQAVAKHIGGASKANISKDIVIRDTLLAWKTSFGNGYGLIAESLLLIYILEQYFLAHLMGSSNVATTKASEARIGWYKVQALAHEVLLRR